MSRVINNFFGKKMHTKCKNIDLFLLTIFIYESAKKPDEEKKTNKRTTKLKLWLHVCSAHCCPQAKC